MQTIGPTAKAVRLPAIVVLCILLVTTACHREKPEPINTTAAPTGAVATQPLTFIAGPSPTGWQLSKQSAMALMSAVG